MLGRFLSTSMCPVQAVLAFPFLFVLSLCGYNRGECINKARRKNKQMQRKEKKSFVPSLDSVVPTNKREKEHSIMQNCVALPPHRVRGRGLVCHPFTPKPAADVGFLSCAPALQGSQFSLMTITLDFGQNLDNIRNIFL